MARQFVAARLRPGHRRTLVDDATLLASELTANAIRHTPARRVRVAVRCAGDRVRIEVCDPSQQPPVVVDAGPLAQGGRGMRLVEALADRWGYDRRPEGKVVWFELSD